ncbi:haloacid dehalogenase [Fulvitalea axinellae]|uniref:Haloacid dehalogenase n=1 Tax=Fulvitalea axinellae TaxID=1182444 RepID=A0AAU9CDM7_9BACT|nr:haloacid dehalogenase [Fulvitalea axinellae]
MDKDIKNIIFDLGGVILNIDIRLSVERFADLAGVTSDEAWGFFKGSEVFHAIEVGTGTEGDLVEAIRSFTGKDLRPEEVVGAWNELLLDFPEERVEALKRLGERYRIFLLSNTNATHATYFEKRFEEAFGEPMSGLFEKVYYSHELGLRKPGEEIFAHVLADAGLDPSETLMVEDTAPNAETAERLGMESLLVEANKGVFSDLFAEALA